MKIERNALNTTKTASKRPHVVQTFTRPGEMVEYVDTHKLSDREGWGTGFLGGDTHARCADKILTGDPAIAEDARALLTRIERAHIETPRKVRKRSPAAGRPLVPAVLAGAPDPMRRRVTEPKATAPLNIVVNCTSSAGIEASTMQKRGIAIAALVQRVALERPVSLYVAVTGHSEGCPAYIGLIKFPSTPIDLARLAYLLSSQGFARGYGFGLMRSARTMQEGGTPRVTGSSYIQWPFHNYDYIGKNVFDTDYKGDTLGDDLRGYFGQDTYYIPGALLSSRDHRDIETNTVAWINSRLEYFKNS